MAQALTVNGQQSSGTQTQNPQSTSQSSSINGATNNTQLTPSSSTLNNTSTSVGIPLVNTQPQVVQVGSNTSTLSSGGTSQQFIKHHKLNSYALSIVAILIIAAVVMAVAINRSAKNTTNY